MNQEQAKDDSLNLPTNKRKREENEPESPRLEEQNVPIYKAFRKAQVNLAKASHHLNTLQDFRTQGKIPKAFKVNIKPQVPNPTTELIIDWDSSLDLWSKPPKYSDKILEET